MRLYGLDSLNQISSDDTNQDRVDGMTLKELGITVSTQGVSSALIASVQDGTALSAEVTLLCDFKFKVQKGDTVESLLLRYDVTRCAPPSCHSHDRNVSLLTSWDQGGAAPMEQECGGYPRQERPQGRARDIAPIRGRHSLYMPFVIMITEPSAVEWLCIFTYRGGMSWVAGG